VLIFAKKNRFIRYSDKSILWLFVDSH